tara:strand:- start:8506 stop:9270 length:765 start_codon:yes stop_codon:yes gene_type:complete
MKKEVIGEFLGTLILVLIGCGSVAIAVLYNFLTLWQVASIWGIGVALAIYSTSWMCNSHLNPAVSFAFFLHKKITFKELTFYSIFQLLGGITGGLLVYLIFENDIIAFEQSKQIVRNSTEARFSAQIFGEFFPNPGFEKTISTTHLQAFMYEMVGTFLLFVIIQIAILPLFSKRHLSPLIIGIGLALLIAWIAPYTQAGFNPARDFGPRLFAFISGWGRSALPQPWYSAITVYIIAPILGSGIAAVSTRSLLNR